jgi:hypothetical protein
MGGMYLQGQVIAISFVCSDALSGIAPGGCDGPSGSLDTSTPGPHSYIVTATDIAGNEQIETITYNVFSLASVFRGLFRPLTDSIRSFQKGSTIPVKFALVSSTGNFFGGESHLFIRDQVTITPTNPIGTWEPATSSGGSNTGNIFRYDTTAGQYIYNLSTKNPIFIAGHTYDFEVRVNNISQVATQKAMIKLGK